MRIEYCENAESRFIQIGEMEFSIDDEFDALLMINGDIELTKEQAKTVIGILRLFIADKFQTGVEICQNT